MIFPPLSLDALVTSSIITPASKNIRPQNPVDAFPRLNVGVVGDREESLGHVLLGGDSALFARHERLALELNGLAVGLGGLLCGSVGLDTGKELVAGTGVADVFNADVDALLDVAVSDLTVEDDTDSGLGYVVDNAGLSVVDLVRHTVWLLGVISGMIRILLRFTDPFWTALHGLLDIFSALFAFLIEIPVRNHVHDVARLIRFEVGREVDKTLGPSQYLFVVVVRSACLLLEVLGEGISGTSSETCGVTHLD